MIFIMPMPPTIREIPADRSQEEAEDPGDLVDNAHHLLLADNRKIILLIAGQAVPPSDDTGNFIFSVRHHIGAV